MIKKRELLKTEDHAWYLKVRSATNENGALEGRYTCPKEKAESQRMIQRQSCGAELRVWRGRGEAAGLVRLIIGTFQNYINFYLHIPGKSSEERGTEEFCAILREVFEAVGLLEWLEL